MKQTLTEAEMLRLWRLRRGVEIPRLDCTVNRSDGPDVDSILRGELRARYLDRLDHAPLSSLVVTEADLGEVEVRAIAPRLAIVTPPPGTRRIVSVRADGWPAPVGADSSRAQVERAAACPLWGRPMAALLPDGNILITPCSDAVIASLSVIIDHGPQIYEFDESLWNDPTF